ncbi:GerMN domain-containing protein [Eubacteriales bacterium mix99]
MQKKVWFLTAMLLILTLVFASCNQKKEGKVNSKDIPTATDEQTGEKSGEKKEKSGETNELIRETVVYYQDDAGYLVPVMRKIPWVEGIAKATLNVMTDTPEQQEDLMMMGLKPLLPADAKVLGMSIRDRVAMLDLNRAVLDCKDATAENNMIQGIVLTLSGFSTIDKVQFLFDGKVVDSMEHGTKVKDPIGPSDVNVEMSDDATAQGAKVTVFYQSTSPSQYDYLIPVTRITSSENTTLETAIQELLNGPKDKDNMTIDIPPDTKLLGAQMEKGTTYLNFSKELRDLANSRDSEAMVMRAIKMAAMQFPEVKQVKVLVEGKDYAESTPLDSTPVFANEYE